LLRAIEIALTALLGLGLGSFATALAWREARNLSWWTLVKGKAGESTSARSQCTSCSTTLGLFDLIPVFSWLFSRGKCRHCKQPVSVLYPITETGVLLACLGIYAAWGFTPAAFCIMAAIPFLAALTIVDSERMILPDRLMILCAVPAFVFIWLTSAANPGHTMIMHGAAAILYAGAIWLTGAVMSFLLKKEALGFGDVKFMAMAGLWIGPLWLPFYLIISGLAGVVWGTAWRVILKNNIFPFGPALIISLYACLLLKGMGFSGGLTLY
jgi:leader peptidase (prepilin peptidase) / N-methyltransferase